MPETQFAWRSMKDAPTDGKTAIVARHRPNDKTPHGWIATILLGHDDDEEPGAQDTILHYNGNALYCGFRGVWDGWMYPEEFAALSAALAEAEARGRRAGIERAAAYHHQWEVRNREAGSPTTARRHAKYTLAIRALATAAPAETEERGTGWRPIAEAPKDGRMIGVPGGCAYWSPADECWVSGVGGAYGRQIRWPLTVWKDLTPPQPTATATREDGHA